MTAVLKREIKSYFTGVTGWVFSAFLLLFAGIYMMVYCLNGHYPNFEYVLSSMSFIYLIAVPLITMRSVAEEKRQKTDQLLYSLPISLTNVIIGKYLAQLIVLLVPMAVMALYPLLLSSFGTVSLKIAYGTLFGFFLLGACLLSIGLFISSATENQLTAAILTLVAMLIIYFMAGLATFVPTDGFSSFVALSVLALLLCLVLWFLTKNSIVSLLAAILLIGGLYIWYTLNTSFFSGLFAEMMNAISVFDRFQSFVDGVFDVNCIVYFISISCVFVFLSVQSLEKRRWSE